MIGTRLDLRLTQTFVIQQKEIDRLCRILQRRIESNVTVTAKLSDGTQRTFSTASELFAFNNPTTRRIQELELASETESPPIRWALIEFDRRNFIAGISIRANATDEEIVVLRQEILEVLHSCKPRYDRISRSRQGLAALIGSGLVALLVVAAVASVTS